MREAKEWQALIREAARHGVKVTEGTAARGLGCWDSTLLRIGRHGRVTLEGVSGRGTGEDREGWDPDGGRVWAELDGVRPLDLLHGFRLLGWKRARAWAVACWAELEGRESVLSIGPVGGWARAIAHLGRALTGWGGDGPDPVRYERRGPREVTVTVPARLAREVWPEEDEELGDSDECRTALGRLGIPGPGWVLTVAREEADGSLTGYLRKTAP